MARRNREVTLCYRMPGCEGGIGMVKIPTNQRVEDLQTMIKAKNPTFLQFVEPEQLMLFLAKLDGEWMPIRGPEVNAMYSGNVPERVAAILRNPNNILAPAQKIGELFPDVEISDMEVHILVQLPRAQVVVTQVPEARWRLETNAETYAEHLSRYRSVAGRLQDHPDVQRLYDALEKVARSTSPVPFVVLENSTGTGKTQMAFNLEASGRYDVFYMLASSPGDTDQPVHKAFYGRSHAFIHCIEQDRPFLLEGSVIEFQRRQKLHLYGLLAALLRGESIFTGPAYRSDVEDVLQKRQRVGAKPCVFFLDEFPRVGSTIGSRDTNTEREGYIIETRSMRNVFRSFDIPVILTATNGTGRNLLSTSTRSRSSPSPWCLLVPLTIFPVLHDGFATLEVPKQIKRIIRHSRPLFVNDALEFVERNPYQGQSDEDCFEYLCRMINFLAPKFRSMKVKRPDEFALGQLELLFCTSYDVTIHGGNFVGSHFASPNETKTLELWVDDNGDLHRASGNEVSGARVTWTPRFRFRQPEFDMLLHLALLTGSTDISHGPCEPLPKPLCQMLDDPKLRPLISFKNTLQRSNDGMRLEALVAASLVLASRRGGIRGMTFSRFLGHFLYELGVLESPMPMALPTCTPTYNFIVPFFSPPNVRWPDWFQSHWNASAIKFANLTRPANDEMIDLRSSPSIISGECKDYSSPIDLDVLKEILSRTPQTTRFHLVIVSRMQLSYFTRAGGYEAASRFLLEKGLLHADIYRISSGSGLEEIRGLERKQRLFGATSPMTAVNGFGKLILFIDLGPSRKRGRGN